jgi:Holliday junction resolvase RusA-like endonuclease
MTTQLLNCREYRLVLPGKAESFRTIAAGDYKARIKATAAQVIKHPLSDKRIEIRIDYFHDGHRRMDMDNIAKCIIDGLTGVAYLDDKQVCMQKSESYDVTKPLVITGETIDIVKPLEHYVEYVIVRIRPVTEYGSRPKAQRRVRR